MLKLTRRMWNKISDVNYEINQMPYVSDPAQYGLRDYWADDLENMQAGDCEDYALKKREILRAVYPNDYDSFLLGVCRVEGPNGERGKGGWHGVLIMRSLRGDYVLDNRYTKVTPIRDQTLQYWWYGREPDRLERKIYDNSWVKLANI